MMRSHSRVLVEFFKAYLTLGCLSFGMADVFLDQKDGVSVWQGSGKNGGVSTLASIFVDFSISSLFYLSRLIFSAARLRGRQTSCRTTSHGSYRESEGTLAGRVFGKLNWSLYQMKCCVATHVKERNYLSRTHNFFQSSGGSFVLGIGSHTAGVACPQLSQEDQQDKLT
jgi:hypothetical protein